MKNKNRIPLIYRCFVWLTLFNGDTSSPKFEIMLPFFHVFIAITNYDLSIFYMPPSCCLFYDTTIIILNNIVIIFCKNNEDYEYYLPSELKISESDERILQRISLLHESENIFLYFSPFLSLSSQELIY